MRQIEIVLGCAALMCGVTAYGTPAVPVVGSTCVVVDYSKTAGKLRPELHSSGWTPRSTNHSQKQNPDVEIVKSMGFKAARTHDWALVNAGQRVVDLHFIFPLMHLDATDPKNYVFGPTDHLLAMTRDCGLDIFYRLGTSIEHTGPKAHFNALIPADFSKVAEIFAATVRHYNRGWANGRKWGIRYWEIWNEPDGINNMWSLPDGDTPDNAALRRSKFTEFYALCVKRLKDEFGDEIKVGGPAICEMDFEYLQALFDACNRTGVKPDFISWHYYGNDPKAISQSADEVRAYCDKRGFTDCELIVNEWHYMDSQWSDLRNANPAVFRRVQEGPTGHNNIDSAAYVLANLIQFQSSKLDQAFYYGCDHEGHWGYMDGMKQKNKVYYACRMFGDIMRDYSTFCASEVRADNYYALPVVSGDGQRKGLLLVDYRNTDQVIELDINGLTPTTKAKAVVLDHTHDNFPCSVELDGNRLTLTKPDKYSAAFFVSFAK